jgi:hypothetical protein
MMKVGHDKGEKGAYCTYSGRLGLQYLLIVIINRPLGVMDGSSHVVYIE